ncbi:MAG TPA: murein biosynthesis integral membrane protein MurJ [Spirochaetota bacterium]|nr:murein biosynthesis integral membrane protein MurJ [Spirochaetota bacterium]
MSSLFRSTSVVAASTLASRILGLVRDMLMAAFFSATGTTDAYYIAFRIPNLARRLVGEGVFTISFIPVYTEHLVGRGEVEAFDLARKALSAFLALLAVLVALGLVFAPQVVHVLAMGFDDAAQVGMTVTMFRIMLPYLLMAGFLAFSMGLLNSHKFFFAPAFAPVLLNVGIISGILVFSGFFEEPLYGVCSGVLAGGLLQVILQVPYLARAGFKMRFSLPVINPDVKRIFRRGLRGIIGMGSQQVNILVATLMASFLAPGSISYIYFSNRLHELVLGLTAVSIGSVVLPEMSELSARKDYGRLGEIYSIAVRSVLFMAIPATVALMIAGFPIVSVLLMHNRFTAHEAAMTYRALFYASSGIVGIAVCRITIPFYYALHDSRTPLYAALASFAVNAACGYFLMRTPLEHAGLTFSVAIAATVQMGFLLMALKKKNVPLRAGGIVLSVLKQGVAAVAMGALVWCIAGFVDWAHDPFSRRALFLVLLVAAGGAVYLVLCLALRAPEARYLLDRLFRRK